MRGLAYACVCLCVSVCVCAHTHTRTHVRTYWRARVVLPRDLGYTGVFCGGPPRERHLTTPPLLTPYPRLPPACHAMSRAHQSRHHRYLPLQAGLWLQLATALQRELQVASAGEAEAAAGRCAGEGGRTEEQEGRGEEFRAAASELRRLSACVVVRLVEVLEKVKEEDDDAIEQHPHASSPHPLAPSPTERYACSPPHSRPSSLLNLTDADTDTRKPGNSPSTSAAPALHTCSPTSAAATASPTLPSALGVLSSWFAHVPSVVVSGVSRSGGSGEARMGEGVGDDGDEEWHGGGGLEESRGSDEAEGLGLEVYDDEAHMLVGPIQQALVAEASYEESRSGMRTPCTPHP